MKLKELLRTSRWNLSFKIDSNSVVFASCDVSNAITRQKTRKSETNSKRQEKVAESVQMRFHN